MKLTLRKIEKALKELYLINPELRVENFLVRSPEDIGFKPKRNLPGVLLVENVSAEEINVALYFNAPTRVALGSAMRRLPSAWSSELSQAFSVAVEETSHFHYLAHHAIEGRKLKASELELQAEIDKFLLFFYSKLRESPNRTKAFQEAFEKCFEKISWQKGLSTEEKERYAFADNEAKKLLSRIRTLLEDSSHREKLLDFLRNYYRMDIEKKLAQAK